MFYVARWRPIDREAICCCIFLRRATTSRDPRAHRLLFYPMIDEFDLDQDGEINEQEFFAIMTDDA